MSDWNFADLFERIAARFPDAPAVIDGERTVRWSELEGRADAFARALAGLDLPPQSKVAVYSRNRAEFLESYLAVLKARLVPVNVNWRYGEDELVYLLDNADVCAVVVEEEFLSLLMGASRRLPQLRHLYVLADPAGTEDLTPSGPMVSPYERAIHDQGLRPTEVRTRSGDDILLVYTGGTTGLPKGVMWRQGDMFDALMGSSRAAFGLPVTDSMDELVAGITLPGPRGLSASPFMHATGLCHQLIMLLAGGTAVVLTGRKFDPEHLWRTVEAQRVTAVVIVGDAFAIPLLEYLDAHPGQLDLSSLGLLSSSGAIWSRSVKEGLLRHLPTVRVYDGLASSEGFGVGGTTMTADSLDEPSQFTLGAHTRIRTDDGRLLAMGEPGTGMAAIGGPLPLGYYKDDRKTEDTFQVIDGMRYSIPGDYVEYLPDGTVRFLGRGSACINTGGEKVYAEEVELVLKDHRAIRDAACIGVADRRFGELVCAVIATAPGASISREDVAAYVRSRLASYKAPRALVVMPEIPRTVQGKIDYPKVREYALAQLGERVDSAAGR